MISTLRSLPRRQFSIWRNSPRFCTEDDLFTVQMCLFLPRCSDQTLSPSEEKFSPGQMSPCGFQKGFESSKVRPEWLSEQGILKISHTYLWHVVSVTFCRTDLFLWHSPECIFRLNQLTSSRILPSFVIRSLVIPHLSRVSICSFSFYGNTFMLLCKVEIKTCSNLCRCKSKQQFRHRCMWIHWKRGTVRRSRCL